MGRRPRRQCRAAVHLLLAWGLRLWALDNGVGDVPAMGWNSWNQFRCDINEGLIRGRRAMVSSGLRDAGYRYVNVDDCWQGYRTSNGHIVPNREKFPSGMRARRLHPRSRTQVGIYSDTAELTCETFPARWATRSWTQPTTVMRSPLARHMCLRLSVLASTQRLGASTTSSTTSAICRTRRSQCATTTRRCATLSMPRDGRSISTFAPGAQAILTSGAGTLATAGGREETCSLSGTSGQPGKSCACHRFCRVSRQPSRGRPSSAHTLVPADVTGRRRTPPPHTDCRLTPRSRPAASQRPGHVGCRPREHVGIRPGQHVPAAPRWEKCRVCFRGRRESLVADGWRRVVRHAPVVGRGGRAVYDGATDGLLVLVHARSTTHSGQ